MVNYVFNHEPARLVAYHYLVMEEMERRGYNPNPIWKNVNWRGSVLGEQKYWMYEWQVLDITCFCRDGSAMIYPEHNNDYLQECIENLKGKGIDIEP